MRFRPATMGRKEPFRTLHNGHSPRACCLQTPSNGLVSEICLCLSLRHDYPFKLGFRGTRDRGCWRCEGVPGELTLVFATPGPVTTLLRDTQVHEFGTVFRFPVDADRRSDTFTSQTVTTLFCSTLREDDETRLRRLHAEAGRSDCCTQPGHRVRALQREASP